MNEFRATTTCNPAREPFRFTLFIRPSSRAGKIGSVKRDVRRALTLGEIEEQIFQREGFRVSFVPLSASDHPLPPYAYPVMAPAGWHVSDWRRVRLAPYVVSFRDVVVYRGDGTRLAADLKLGHLRDTYYAAHYGTLAADAARRSAAAP